MTVKRDDSSSSICHWSLFSSLFSAICYRGGDGERGKVDREGGGIWVQEGKGCGVGGEAVSCAFTRRKGGWAAEAIQV